MTANEKISELGFWGNCCNTFHEEQKQYVYARLMGIRREHWSLRVYGDSIVDIGGGPVSMLLKCHDLGEGSAVVDPFLNDVPMHVDADRSDTYPKWVTSRYEEKGLAWLNVRGEDLMCCDTWHEAWIYNVLQHVDDPALVVKNALAICRKLRIFEPVNIPPYEGHPHMLTEIGLNDWCGSSGDVIPISYEGLHGDYYVNVVEGKAK